MKLLISTIRTQNKTTELALKYMYSVVSDAPIEAMVHVFDSHELDSDIYEYIIRERFGVVYFHCDQNNELRIGRVAEMIKKVAQTTIVLVGGMEVSFDTRKFMNDNPAIDYVIRGEGEPVFFNFIRNMLTYEYDWEGVDGLAYRQNGEIVVNPYDAVVDVEKLPSPYDTESIKESDVIYYETIRGTSDRSIYQQFLPDARVRSLSIGRVCTELRYFLVKGVSKIVFLDKWFNYNTERAYRIFEYIIFNDNGKTSFEMDIDGDNLDEETIRLLSEARPGLFTFNIDIASTNPETLAAIGRKENVYQLMYNVTKLLNNENIEVKLKITAGLPLETADLFARSFNKVFGLGDGTSLIIETARVPRGCLLRDDIGKYGYIYTDHAPFDVLANSFLSATEMIKIKTLAKVTKVFVNDNFKQAIPRILNDTGMKPYTLFSKLTDFIYARHLDGKMNKLENLYRILYRYASAIYDDYSDSLKLQILKEVLHDDMEHNMSTEEVKKFEKRGWEIEA